MEYGIRELSVLTGISARTLRYYDEVNLLKPSRTTKAGYRFYGEQEAALLLQILFFRERDFDLKSIRKMIYESNFDVTRALEEHLAELENQRAHLDALILTVKQTIRSRKGEYEMSIQEKFQALKEQAIKENEEKYGAEVREKYGDMQAELSRQKIMRMTETEWQRFQELEAKILEGLKSGVQSGISPKSEGAKELVLLHREWLCKAIPQYTPEIHKGIARLYTADERFTAYYDRETEGCARLLEQAVCYWADNLF